MDQTSHASPLSARILRVEDYRAGMLIGGLLGACLFLGACDSKPTRNEGAKTGTSMDLLAREPDLLIEQAGHLTLDPKDQWQGQGLGGWYALTRPPHGDFPAAAEMSHPKAQLLLSASFPIDRELELTAWIPNKDAASPSSLDVFLNGIPIKESLPLGTSPEVKRLHCPAAAWKLGENLLELRVPLFSDSQSEGVRFDPVQVASVEWGPTLSVTQEGQTQVLSPGTGLRYELEPAGSPRLDLRGQAQSNGELELRYSLIDPATGAPDLRGLTPRLLPVEKGSVQLDLPTPKRAQDVLRLELVWHADDPEAALRIEGLQLTGCNPTPKPPVIFISIDTFAARHLDMYGYDRQTTPHLQEFMEEAVLFERCLANAPWTTPSYLSVLSGLFARAHQIDPEGPGVASLFDQWQMADNRWTLAESMRARGYSTAGFVDTVWLDERFRVNQGFDLWDDTAAGLPGTHPAYGIAYVTEMADRWLRALPRGRTPFLFLHALDAHGPYFPELPYLGTFQNDWSLPARLALAGADYQAAGAMPEWMAKTILHGINMLTPKELREGHVPRQIEVEPIVARYDEALLKVDSYVGKFLDDLRAKDFWDDAIVIVTGDHGEAFKEEYYGHARLYEEVLEVPLLIKLPQGRGAGKRISSGVQLVDLYPTLMELTSNQKAPDWLHGRSLLPLIDDGSGPSIPLFSEGGHFEAYTVIVDQWKLIESYPSKESGASALITHPRVPKEFTKENFPQLVGEPLTAEILHSIESDPDYSSKINALRQLLAKHEPYLELYDLEHDPQEANDLSASKPEKVKALLVQLEALKEESRAAQASAIHGIASDGLSSDQLESLRDLGYISDEEAERN